MTRSGEGGGSDGGMIRRLALRLLERGVPAGASRDGLIGDLVEMRADRARSRGPARADVWFLGEAVFAVVRYHGAVRWAARRLRGRGDGPGRGYDGLPGQAFRSLLRSPGPTVTAVGALAIGFAGSATLGTLAHHHLLRPLPFPDADRLVVIEHEVPGYAMGGEVAAFGGHLGQVLHYGERSEHLESIAAWSTWDGVLSGDGAPPGPVHTGFVTSELDRVLGVPPVLGRSLRPEEPFPPQVPRGVVVLSHALWQGRYGGAPDVVGRVVERDGFEFEVVGVAAPRPSLSVRPIDAWHPLPRSRMESAPAQGVRAMVARLAPGSTPDMARRELDALIAELPGRWPGTPLVGSVRDGRMRARVTPLRAWLVADVRAPLLVLAAAAALLLLIAVTNVTALLLVRAHARRDEVAVRIALGACRRTILAGFATEALILVLAAALPAGVAGLFALAVLSGDGSVAALPVAASPPSGLALAVAVAAVAVPTWLVLALAPWAHFGNVATLRLGGRTRPGTSDRAAVRGRRLLVGLQVGVAVWILVGAVTAYRSALALGRVDPGFRDSDVLVFRVLFPFRDVAEAGRAMDRASPFYLELRDRLAALPGVRGVGFGECVFMSRACEGRGLAMRPEGWEGSGDEELPVTAVMQVSEGFLEVLGVPLLAGRPLVPADRRERSQGVLVSRGAAERFWPGEDPLGKRIGQSSMIQGSDTLPPFRVVGVVGDARLGSLGAPAEPTLYAPIHLRGQGSDRAQFSFVLHTSEPPGAVAAAARREVAALRPDVAVTSVETTASILGDSTAALDLSLRLLVVASGVALLLGLLGVYGVVAYAVRLRERELGIRIAVGAAPGRVRGMVLRQGTVAVFAGVAVGAAGALVAGRSLDSLALLVVPVDAATCAAVAVATATVAVGAAWLPARRAARGDPARLLREG